MTKAFWVVWCDCGGPPTVKHDSFESAKAEASRLAQRNEGKTFHVLEAKGAAIVERVQWRDVDDRCCDCGIPF